MTERSLQETYRKGRTFAAYLHLSHPTAEKSAARWAPHRRLRSVWPTVGVEIPALQAVPPDHLNQLLAEFGEPPLAKQEHRPGISA